MSLLSNLISTPSSTATPKLTVMNTNLTGAVNTNYLVVFGNQSLIFTLPASPAPGDSILLTPAHAGYLTYPLTIERNGKNIGGVADDVSVNIDGLVVQLTFIDESIGWSVNDVGTIIDSGILAGTTYPQLVTDTGPVAFWMFNTTSGTVLPDLIATTDGTILGTETTHFVLNSLSLNQYESNSSIRFLNTTDITDGGMINVGKQAAMENTTYTVEMVVRPEAGGGREDLFTNYSGSGAIGLTAAIENDNKISVDHNGIKTISATALNDDESYHLIFQRDDASDTNRIFIDGVLDQTGNDATNPTYDGGSKVTMAGYHNGTNFIGTYYGIVQSVAYYDKYLGDAKIADLAERAVGWAEWNEDDKTSNITVTTKRTAADSGTGNEQVRSTGLRKTGKYYVEFTLDTLTSGIDAAVGIATQDTPIASANLGAVGSHSYRGNGQIRKDGSIVATTSTYAQGDVINMAVNLDTGKVFFGKNGTWLDSANPAIDANPHITGISGPVSLYFGTDNNANSPQVTVKSGKKKMTYTVPSGFKSGWPGGNEG